MNIKQNPKLFVLVTSVFNRFDPQGLIRMGAPPDEYCHEVERIMEYTAGMTSIAATNQIIFNTFKVAFGADHAGTPDVYEPLAITLFNLLRNEGLI